MRLVDNRDSRDPDVNLAIEEYCVRHVADRGPLLLLYVNRPSVLLGKNQNPLEEICLPFAVRHRLPIVRRISGGGTVVHDEGNLNFCFVWPHRVGQPVRFPADVEPVVRALAGLGVRAEVGDRHDLRVDGWKISGNAQFATVHGRMSHGTLLFESDLERMRETLRVERADVRSHSVKSVRSPVANLRPRLPAGMDLEAFRDAMRSEILGPHRDSPPLTLTNTDWREIERLADHKYRTWKWAFGRTPPFEVHRRGRIGDREVGVVVHAREFRVERLEFPEGVPRGADEIESAVRGVRFERDALEEALGIGGLGEWARDWVPLLYGGRDS